MNDVKQDAILKSINSMGAVIEADIERLTNIVATMNTGDVTMDINDRLISNLNTIQFEDVNIEHAIEYLTLILSNVESQKINYNKQVSEELIKVLGHTLAAVKNLENCAIDVFTHIDNFDNVNGLKEQSTKNVNENNKPINNKTANKVDYIPTLITAVLPNNKISNGILWAILLFGAFWLVFSMNPEAIKAFNTTTTEGVNNYKKVKDK